jgi:hypothetical protein
LLLNCGVAADTTPVQWGFNPAGGTRRLQQGKRLPIGADGQMLAVIDGSIIPEKATGPATEAWGGFKNTYRLRRTA